KIETATSHPTAAGVMASPPSSPLAPGPVEPCTRESLGNSQAGGAMPALSSEPRSKLTPLSPGRYALQVTLGQIAHDRMRHAQQLLSHRVASTDLAEVVEHALEALVRELEKTKFA